MDNISTSSKQSEVTPGGLFNRREIAQFLGVSERTIGNMVAQRRIPIVRWGRNVRFDPIKVRRALSKYEIEEL